MAKSMRSKKEKRLRAIRREMVEPLYEKKDVAKLAAQEAALAAPKLPVRTYKNNTNDMETSAIATTSAAALNMVKCILKTVLHSPDLCGDGRRKSKHEILKAYWEEVEEENQDCQKEVSWQG
ncbi:hypothetical protein LguiA_024830 [Lonicera macranthoides]